METAIICSVISAVASIVVAVIGNRMLKAQKKSEADKIKENAAAERRREESLLAMQLTFANTKLTVGVATAQKTGHANGEIEEGLAEVKKAQDKYEAFLHKIATEQLAS